MRNIQLDFGSDPDPGLELFPDKFFHLRDGVLGVRAESVADEFL